MVTEVTTITNGVQNTINLVTSPFLHVRLLCPFRIQLPPKRNSSRSRQRDGRSNFSFVTKVTTRVTVTVLPAKLLQTARHGQSRHGQRETLQVKNVIRNRFVKSLNVSLHTLCPYTRQIAFVNRTNETLNSYYRLTNSSKRLGPRLCNLITTFAVAMTVGIVYTRVHPSSSLAVGLLPVPPVHYARNIVDTHNIVVKSSIITSYARGSANNV